ncbi:MAG: chemotaxis protein CheX [Sulfurimonas sp.]|uniref:chemotaxis protein CheX n=1 Tax=Sulfurimonas sp. TaxID=2022749 RepID=UPI0025D614C0|nr:chemotaxis protein CheX [Sulfurimonas sp.]MCK9491459.1 chemotaxis protein CheX [Sulfurimonas sp.]
MNVKSKSIAIVNFIGVVEERNARLIQGLIISKLDMYKEQKIKAVLVSFKSAVYKENSKDLVSLVKILDALSKNTGLGIAIIDYDVELFKILKIVAKGTKVKLFKNAEVATLFLDPKVYKEAICVLLYDEDEQNSKDLASELSKYGYSVIRAKDPKEFQERMHEKAHDIIITQSALNEKISNVVESKNKLLLSKKLIINLPVFMDTAVETLVSFTGLHAQKSAHSIKGFDTSIDADNICAVMHFKGDLEGYFTLVFPKSLAIITLESLLGEKISDNDMETLRDGVGEFCNIITGSIKTAFDKKDIKLLFDLPKTYNSLKATQGYIGENNGVWIDMQLADKPFYMFITK